MGRSCTYLELQYIQSISSFYQVISSLTFHVYSVHCSAYLLLFNPFIYL